MQGILLQSDRFSFVSWSSTINILNTSDVDGLAYLQCTESCTQPALKEETIPVGRLKKEQTPFGTDYTKGMLLWPARTHLGKCNINSIYAGHFSETKMKPNLLKTKINHPVLLIFHHRFLYIYI